MDVDASADMGDSSSFAMSSPPAAQAIHGRFGTLSRMLSACPPCPHLARGCVHPQRVVWSHGPATAAVVYRRTHAPLIQLQDHVPYVPLAPDLGALA